MKPRVATAAQMVELAATAVPTMAAMAAVKARDAVTAAARDAARDAGINPDSSLVSDQRSVWVAVPAHDVLLPPKRARKRSARNASANGNAVKMAVPTTAAMAVLTTAAMAVLTTAAMAVGNRARPTSPASWSAFAKHSDDGHG